MPLDFTTFLVGAVTGWLAGPRGPPLTAPLMAPTLVIHRGPSGLTCVISMLVVMMLTALITAVFVHPAARATFLRFFQRVINATGAASVNVYRWCLVQLSQFAHCVTQFGQRIQIGARELFTRVRDAFSAHIRVPRFTSGVAKNSTAAPTQSQDTQSEGAHKNEFSTFSMSNNGGWVLVPSGFEP